MRALIAAMILCLAGGTAHAGSYITLFVAAEPSGSVHYDEATGTLVGDNISISYVTNANTAKGDLSPPPNPLVEHTFETATMSFTTGKLLDYHGAGWAFGEGGSFEIKGALDIQGYTNPEVIYRGVFTNWQNIFAVDGKPGVYQAYLGTTMGHYGPGLAEAYGTNTGNTYFASVYFQFGAASAIHTTTIAAFDAGPVDQTMGGEVLNGGVTISTIPGVPEPSSLGLIGIGLSMLILRLRRPI